MCVLDESAASFQKTHCNVTLALTVADFMCLVYGCHCGEHSDFYIVKKKLSDVYKADTTSDFSW
jgi:hypothetical protein